jgi:hypothetical protein
LAALTLRSQPWLSASRNPTRRPLAEQEYMVKLDEVMNFVAAVAGILRETIKDRVTIMVITGRVHKLLEANYGHQE